MSAERPFVLHTRVVTGTGGGPEKTILNSPRFLATLGYDSLCAYMHPPSDPGFETLEKRAADAQTPLVGIEDRGPWDWRAPRRLLELCRRHRVDVWHGHDYKSNAIGLMVRRFWPMKLVATAHGWVKFTRKTPLYHAVDRFCLRRCDHVVCVSDDLLQTCIAKGVRSDRCCLIENAIDTEHWRRRMSPDEAKRQLGLTPGRLLVGAVGRLSDEKGFNGLIRAADRLLSEGLDFELAIAGEGDYGPALQRLIRERQREDRIRLLGFRADTLDLFQAMDVFVLSSLREGLPNVVLEAMATETPVVATRIAGVPRVIEP
ncbi:MAG: glycosyltransferase, partial [Pirellulales bacterium]|nr:glycosyltransferase [Pirellulales bacterium]